MLQLFEHTGERYLHLCSEKKYELSDFIRRIFQNEKNRIEKHIEQEDFIYMKLCGDNELLTKERLTDEHLKGLCAVLEEDESVKSLDLRYNRITDKGAEYLSCLLNKNRAIVELNLMGNDIGELGAKCLAEALKGNGTLRVLRMVGNKIGDAGGMQLAQSLQVNRSLEEIDLGECDLKISSIIAFATVLRCNTSLKTLNLDRPLLWTQQEETTVHMENMLYVNTTLRELHLAKYNMGDFGGYRLCDALMVNTSLTVLDLSCNRITRDGAKALAKVLRHNTPLQFLDLGYNRIHDQGVEAIAHALTYCNSNLRGLVITYNEFQDKGLLAITTALELSSTLKQVFLWGNTFSSDAIKVYAQQVDNYRFLESQTDVRPYSVDGTYHFSLLPHNVDYRMYRYTAPIYGSDVPANRSYAIM